MDPLAHEELDGAPSTSGPRVRSEALMKAGETKAKETKVGETKVGEPATSKMPRPVTRRRLGLGLLAVAGIASGIAIGNALAVRHNATAAARGDRAWHGRVTRVVRSGAQAADAQGGVQAF